MPFNKIISSVELSLRKKKVIKTILSKPQKNKGVINIHSIDKDNIGDFFCAPHHYFQKLRNTEVDVFDFKRESKKVRQNFIEKVCSNAIIVGGGGLLNRGGFKRQMQLMESLTEKNKKVVLWGLGHNEKDPRTFGKVAAYNVDVTKFGLVGTRDYSMPGQWVPCVSCLHTVFDKDYSESQEIGVIFHQHTMKRPEITSKFKNYPSTSNSTDLESLIAFIGRSEKIVTDSYHAMYWGMLLNKKVAVVPNSSKFFDFKYQPVFSTFDTCIKDLNKANIYSGVLDECREINLDFSEKVFDYLEK